MADKYISRKSLRIEPYEISHEKVDDTYLEILQDLSYDIINKLCYQDFDQEGTDEAPVVKMIDGDGKDTIFLPKRLIKLIEVRDYTDFDEWDTYEKELFLVKPKYIIWNQFGEVTARSLVGEPGIFTEGKGNIGIVGIWGWPVVPKPIQYLQGKMIKKMVDDKTFANKFSSESVGDYSYNLKPTGDRLQDITGDAEMDSIIRQYRNWTGYGAY